MCPNRLATDLDAATALRAAGIDNPVREARLLRAHTADPARFAELLARRVAHEPMAFLLGSQGFWTLEFEVSPATLIPRPDSETLIDAAMAALPDRAMVRRVLDLGTGTGCLLLAALVEFPAAFGVGIDFVPDAAHLAARNAAANGLAGRAAFVCGNWVSAIAGRFDLVFSNPPYITTTDIAGLMPDVAQYEPASALDGGADGLDAYRQIVPTLPGLLSQGGVAVLELGQGQAEAVAGLAALAGLTMTTRDDFGGIARAAVLRRA